MFWGCFAFKAQYSPLIHFQWTLTKRVKIAKYYKHTKPDSFNPPDETCKDMNFEIMTFNKLEPINCCHCVSHMMLNADVTCAGPFHIYRVWYQQCIFNLWEFLITNLDRVRDILTHYNTTQNCGIRARIINVIFSALMSEGIFGQCCYYLLQWVNLP